MALRKNSYLVIPQGDAGHYKTGCGGRKFVKLKFALRDGISQATHCL